MKKTQERIRRLAFPSVYSVTWSKPLNLRKGGPSILVSSSVLNFGVRPCALPHPFQDGMPLVHWDWAIPHHCPLVPGSDSDFWPCASSHPRVGGKSGLKSRHSCEPQSSCESVKPVVSGAKALIWTSVILCLCKACGLRNCDNWFALGMRGSSRFPQAPKPGSHSLEIWTQF